MENSQHQLIAGDILFELLFAFLHGGNRFASDGSNDIAVGQPCLLCSAVGSDRHNIDAFRQLITICCRGSKGLDRNTEKRPSANISIGNDIGNGVFYIVDRNAEGKPFNGRVGVF